MVYRWEKRSIIINREGRSSLYVSLRRDSLMLLLFLRNKYTDTEQHNLFASGSLAI